MKMARGTYSFVGGSALHGRDKIRMVRRAYKGVDAMSMIYVCDPTTSGLVLPFLLSVYTLRFCDSFWSSFFLLFGFRGGFRYPFILSVSANASTFVNASAKTISR